MESSKYTDIVIKLKNLKPNKLPSNRVFLAGIFLVLVLILIGVTAKNIKPQDSAPIVADGKELPKQAKQLLQEIGEKMELPQGETPTMATVTDVDKLENQPFFKNAKDGDSIVIYTSTKKAILYRLSTHKIIEVAPISLDTNGQGAQPQQ